METTYTYRPPYPVVAHKPTLSMACNATTTKDWLQAFSFAAFSGAVTSAVSRPFNMKYGLGIATFSCTFIVAGMGVFASAVRRLEGYEPNEFLVKKYPYRLDYPGEQIRVEPFRIPTREELEEIIRNPRQ